MLKKISNIGDCGITCDFGDEVNKKTNKEVIKLFNFIQESVKKKKDQRNFKLHTFLQQTYY